jgi:hypothetical protein
VCHEKHGASPNPNAPPQYRNRDCKPQDTRRTSRIECQLDTDGTSPCRTNKGSASHSQGVEDRRSNCAYGRSKKRQFDVWKHERHDQEHQCQWAWWKEGKRGAYDLTDVRDAGKYILLTTGSEQQRQRQKKTTQDTPRITQGAKPGTFGTKGSQGRGECYDCNRL